MPHGACLKAIENFLYPEIEPFATHRLRVSDLHTIYVAEYGNPEGQPMLLVHPGPGAAPAINSVEQRLFNPQHWRLILVHQRGCGESLPLFELKENTTIDLLEDMEHVREKLNISSWKITGLGWGAALALLYAERHPDRVTSLILQGLFMCRRADIKWLFQSGADQIFPDAFDTFSEYISDEEHQNLLLAYYNRLTSADDTIQMGAARRWTHLLLSIGGIAPTNNLYGYFIDNPNYTLAYSKIASHYFINKTFMEENQILNSVHRLRNIPGTILHGRYDVIAPPEAAYELHKAWPGSIMHIVPNAAHSYFEPPMTAALVEAIKNFES